MHIAAGEQVTTSPSVKEPCDVIHAHAVNTEEKSPTLTSQGNASYFWR